MLNVSSLHQLVYYCKKRVVRRLKSYIQKITFLENCRNFCRMLIMRDCTLPVAQMTEVLAYVTGVGKLNVHEKWKSLFI